MRRFCPFSVVQCLAVVQNPIKPFNICSIMESFDLNLINLNVSQNEENANGKFASVKFVSVEIASLESVKSGKPSQCQLILS